MLLKKLRLKNIRSYVDAEIDFPANYVLLSGDIGSGKTTALLAIEFALFGLLKGELSGTSLLRNGRHRGEVELHFEVDKKEVVIIRTLKRSESSVTQDSGSIVIDGIRTELTAQELKARILSIFGYPAGLVSKSKLVYRYTVYTPQEQMKNVLADSSERLNILRQVFDVDRFKRVAENITTVLRFLREQCRELQGKTFDIEQKKKLLEQQKTELEAIVKSFSLLKQESSLLSQRIAEKESILKNLEETANKALKARALVEICEITLSGIDNSVRRINLESENIRQELEEAGNIRQEQLDEAVLSITKKELADVESGISEVSRSLGEKEAIRRFSVETKDSVAKILLCPVCKQQVSDEHKHRITEECNKKSSELQVEIARLQAERTQLQQKRVLLNAEAENLQRNKQLVQAQQERMKRSRRLQERQAQIQTELVELQAEKLAKIRQQEEAKKELLFDTGNYENEKIMLQALHQQQAKNSLHERELATKQQFLNISITRLDGELKEKQAAAQKLESLQNISGWLGNEFSSIVALIEQHVMVRLHAQFNELFQKWFSLLVEDAMQSRLDENFTPVIVQNGYETSVESLSGGERTACALAYRLALNRVINDIIHSIRTKELLILDEPTEGFSSEQLDRLGQVLEELDAKQVILVSHEPKLEDFVDSVISLKKEEHVTRIA